MSRKTELQFVLPISYFILTAIISVCSGERRIIDGKTVTANHPYMVYLRKEEHDKKTYVSWLCGGAIIKPNLVLTAAACVEDVNRLYVIAGTNKYVEEENRDNECVETMIKKVVYVCVPKAYYLDYNDINKWGNFDIAVIKVESDIVNDVGYEIHCNYSPKVIDINFDVADLQETGKEALILGWGHTKHWRDENDTTNYNQEILKYGATKIYDKEACFKEYEIPIDKVVKKYAICTLNGGPFNDAGETIRNGPVVTVDGCDKPAAPTTSIPSKVGICQNDHGGPLISWVRNKPVVIGIASAFKIKKDSSCSGPFIYTSTYDSSRFLKCVIEDFQNAAEEDSEEEYYRRSMPDYCKLPAKERGFAIIERKISWPNHPDGSAVTERIPLRPLKPMYHASLR